jgi:hypothetical protein
MQPNFTTQPRFFIVKDHVLSLLLSAWAVLAGMPATAAAAV